MGAGRDSGATLPAHCVRGVPAGAKLVVAVFVVLTVAWPTLANDSFAAVRDAISNSAGWLYGFVVSMALVVCVVLTLGHWGSVRLGSDGERPEFSWISWTAMLFAAGMGIGLVFWSIAEPLTHYADNPLIAIWTDNPSDLVRARVAMEITFFHWGLMPWALYALAGLIFAYSSFRKGEPLTIRSAMRPLIGDAVDRWPGKLIDVFAIVATVFGLATSLGFGAAQINAGLERLFGWQVSTEHKLLLVAVIAGAAVLSVSSGLKRGIRLLSLANVWLAALILVVVLVSAPIIPIARNFSIRLADYLVNLPWLTFETARDQSGWSSIWTTFYWGWWISWTPFVGLFIARISRGRTVREFVLGVLLVPTGITFVWLSIMGGAAISAARAGPEIIEIARENSGAVALCDDRFPPIGPVGHGHCRGCHLAGGDLLCNQRRQRRPGGHGDAVGRSPRTAGARARAMGRGYRRRGGRATGGGRSRRAASRGHGCGAALRAGADRAHGRLHRRVA